jgi:hypothetical protein
MKAIHQQEILGRSLENGGISNLSLISNVNSHGLNISPPRMRMPLQVLFRARACMLQELPDKFSS